MYVVSSAATFMKTFPISEKNNSFYSQNQFPTSETLGRIGTSFWRSDFWVFLVDKRQLRLVDGIQDIKANFCAPSKIREIVAPNACIHFLYVSEMVAWGSTNSYFLSLRGRRKNGRGRGRGEGEKREREEKERKLTLSPQSLSLFPFLPIPTPFDACYAGYYFLGG